MCVLFAPKRLSAIDTGSACNRAGVHRRKVGHADGQVDRLGSRDQASGPIVRTGTAADLTTRWETLPTTLFS